MKQYVYTADELGLSRFSDGILRLDCETTRDFDAADVCVCPEPLFKFTDRDALGLIMPRMERAPHVFLDLSEHFTVYNARDNGHIFIRAALKQSMLDLAPNSIPWPWPAKNYGFIAASTTPFEVDVTFHGWLSNLGRKVSVKACAVSDLITADIQTYPNFFGHQPQDVQARRESLMITGLTRARMALTQESIPGVLPYRFYEAMSAGRCQVYVGSNHVLPFADHIPYGQFVSFLPADHADEADVYVKDWVTRYDDVLVRERGAEARACWERWLDPDKWVELLTFAVAEKLEHMRRGGG